MIENEIEKQLHHLNLRQIELNQSIEKINSMLQTIWSLLTGFKPVILKKENEE